MRINFVAQVVLGGTSGSTQTGSSLCVPLTTGEETSCYTHTTTVPCGSPAASARSALVPDCAGTLCRDWAWNGTQNLTIYPGWEVNQHLTSPYCQFWSSSTGQAKKGHTLRCKRAQAAALLMTVVSAGETGLLGRTCMCHETTCGTAKWCYFRCLASVPIFAMAFTG